MIGATIMTSYNKRTYKIDDVEFNITPRDTFTTEEKEISYVEYFKTKYDSEIKNMNQPVLISLNSRTGIKLILIPEFC